MTTVEGQQKSTSHEVTNYTYDLIGGAWQLMTETTTSHTAQTDGGFEDTTTIKTYSRDANGVCTGISQTKTGTSSSVGTTGGTTTYTLQNYSANFQFDPQQGWYLADESYDWTMDTSSGASTGTTQANAATAGTTAADQADSGSALTTAATPEETSDNPAVESKTDKSNTDDTVSTHRARQTMNELTSTKAAESASEDATASQKTDKSLSDESTDNTRGNEWSGSHSESYSTASSVNGNIDGKKLMPVYNEKRQADMESQIMKFQQAAQERQNDSDKNTAQFQKQSQQQQVALEKLVDEFRRATQERRNEISKLIEQFQRNFGSNPNQFMY